MRTTAELLRVALGNPDFGRMERIAAKSPGCFDLFNIELPVRDFRGLPPNWAVIVLNPQVVHERKSSITQITDEARNLLSSIPSHRPVLIISDITTVHLGDEFSQEPRNVFCIDAANLPAKVEYKSDPRFSPFVQALRRKGLAKVYSASDFMPYSRGKPARGWQFYGRQYELRKLTDTDENYLLIGSRRVGKTSLMQEAYRCLKERGEKAYYVDVQNRTRSGDVAGDLLRELSPKDASYAVRHGGALGERPMAVALKRMAQARERTILLIDELGNVIVNRPNDDWNFLGLLRKYAQNGNLRLVVSCFQEVFIKQQQEFEGPLVNFASALRLTLFTEAEVDQSFLAPFDLWMNLRPAERNELRVLVSSTVGCHPYFLQYFCSQLFERMAEQNRGSLLENAKTLVRADLLSCFESPQNEVFYHSASALFKYLFLLRCKEADDAGIALASTVIEDEWLEKILLTQGFSSTIAARRNILEGLELRGFTAPVDGSRSRQRIAAPVMYLYAKRAESPVGKYIDKLGSDARAEADDWGLAKSIIG
jgi:hypothetical protein